jgi:branched-chain amino acid transport system substrate-binding protein
MVSKVTKIGERKSGYNAFKTIGIMLLVLTLSLALTSIGIAGPKVIKIGGTMPLSGPAAADGKRFVEGRKLAVEKINEDGGVLGAKLELVMRDDEMQPAKVTSLYESLIRQEKLDFLLDSMGAQMVVPAMAVAQKYDKLMVSSYSGSPGLLDGWGGKQYFSAATQTRDKSFVNWWYRGLTDFLWDFGSWNYKPDFPRPKTLAVVSENQLWGIEQHKMWKPYAEEQGWNIVVEEFADWTQMEFSALISKIKSAGPDAIFVEFYYFRCVPFVKQLREQGAKVNFLIMSESGTRADWLDPKEGVGPELGNGVLTFAYVPKTYHGGGIDDLRKRFQTKFNSPPGFLEAAGYAQIQILAQAIELAGSTKTSDVREALMTGTFQTATGPTKFNNEGLNELWNPSIGQWIDGDLEIVYPSDAQTHKPIYPYLQ